MTQEWFWRFDAAGELAEFVTPDSFQGCGLVHGLYELRSDPLAVAREFYGRLLEEGLRYDVPGLSLGGGLQPVIPAGELLAGRREGTCLDLALMFASMLRYAQLQPFLAVFASPLCVRLK